MGQFQHANITTRLNVVLSVRFLPCQIPTISNNKADFFRQSAGSSTYCRVLTFPVTKSLNTGCNLLKVSHLNGETYKI